MEIEMKKNQIPDLCAKKERCCGCMACLAVCPVGAISEVRDDRGFPYPQIDESKCIRCGKCLRNCSFKKRFGE